MDPDNQSRKFHPQGMLLGIIIGIAIGLALDSIPIGVGVGVALGAGFSTRKIKEPEDKK